MEKREVKATWLDERLRAQITAEVAAAVKAGDDDRALGVVTVLAELLAEAIGLAKSCDEEYVDTAFFAVDMILTHGVDQTAALPWPRDFISTAGQIQ